MGRAGIGANRQPRWQISHERYLAPASGAAAFHLERRIRLKRFSHNEAPIHFNSALRIRFSLRRRTDSLLLDRRLSAAPVLCSNEPSRDRRAKFHRGNPLTYIALGPHRACVLAQKEQRHILNSALTPTKKQTSSERPGYRRAETENAVLIYIKFISFNSFCRCSHPEPLTTREQQEIKH